MGVTLLVCAADRQGLNLRRERTEFEGKFVVFGLPPCSVTVALRLREGNEWRVEGGTACQ